MDLEIKLYFSLNLEHVLKNQMQSVALCCLLGFSSLFWKRKLLFNTRVTPVVFFVVVAFVVMHPKLFKLEILLSLNSFVAFMHFHQRS